MQENSVNKINIGIFAHVDAGKTTTVEQMLYKSGEIKRPGSVDSGSTQTDWLAIERERGISVRSSSTTLQYGNMRINIIDTPGHMDFTGEAERAMLALDAVVLIISAVEGVQPQTERFWRNIAELAIPCLIFVNKIDRTGCDPAAILQDIRKNLSSDIIVLNRTENEGTPDAAVFGIPLSALSEDETFGICECDESLALRFLDGEAPGEEELAKAMKERIERGGLYPVLFGAASLGEGIEDLLGAITAYLPSADTSIDEPPSGVVYKVEHDSHMGKVAHVRLFAGRMQNRDTVSLSRFSTCNDTQAEENALQEKVTQIRSVMGERQRDIGIISGGDIAAVYGLERARAGDIIGDPAGLPSKLLGRSKIAVPLLSVQAYTSPERQNELQEALMRISDEDPLLNCEWNAQERELSIKIMGPIQLEVLAYTLKERHNLDVSFSKPLVIYKETPAKSGVGYEEYTMPKPCWAIVKLQIDPLPRGSGYVFESRVRDNDIFYRYQNHIALSIPETLKQGLLGWEVVDLRATLIGGEHHVQHTHNMDFFLATPIAVMDGLRNCGTDLLEPVLKMNLTADEGLAGKLIGDILSMRGETGNPVIKDGSMHIEVLVPVATSMDYPVAFASLTSGHGRIKTEFHSYRECPIELGATTKRRGVNPLDRSKWILFKRGAVIS